MQRYGREIARRFLLGYSEKLWGLPCHRLSPAISGKRLQGLNLRTFLVETVRGRRARTRHLDGRFLYPRPGFGLIAERLAESAGRQNLRTGAQVTRIAHDGGRIRGGEVNGSEMLPVDEVVSTLPLPLFLRLMDPAPPAALLNQAASLGFRPVVLAGLFVNRPRATHVGSVYFPDPGFPMTRVYEPKNRSAAMAPEGQTMLVSEIPCGQRDAVWTATDAEILRLTRSALDGLGWFEPHEILGGCVRRLPAAYPVLELGAEETVKTLLAALRPIRNLQLAGRNGLFRYNHTHHMLRFGHDAVAHILQSAAGPDAGVGGAGRGASETLPTAVQA